MRAIALQSNGGEEGQNSFADGLDASASARGNPDFTIGADGSIQASASGEAGVGIGDAAQNAIGALGTCSIGAILGRLIAALIGQLINMLMQFLSETLFNFVGGEIDCAATPDRVCVTEPKLQNIGTAGSLKETGYGSPSPSGYLKIALSGVSWDSIMYCIVNEILTYITQATIAWINSGFNGNPVFVQNPQAFVQGIANREVANFAYELSGGIQQATNQAAGSLAATAQRGAYQLFGPIKDQVVMNMIGDYTRGQGFYLPSPTITEAQYYAMHSKPGQGFQWQGFDTYAKLYEEQNYGYPASVRANQYANYLAAQAQYYGMQDLQINNGFRNWGECAPGTVRAFDGRCAPQNYLAATLGGQVKGELENRSMMKYLRVSLAQDFDSIITALVNQLMRIAINKMFEGADKANSAIQGAVR